MIVHIVIVLFLREWFVFLQFCFDEKYCINTHIFSTVNKYLLFQSMKKHFYNYTRYFHGLSRKTLREENCVNHVLSFFTPGHLSILRLECVIMLGNNKGNHCNYFYLSSVCDDLCA